MHDDRSPGNMRRPVLRRDAATTGNDPRIHVNEAGAFEVSSHSGDPFAATATMPARLERRAPKASVASPLTLMPATTLEAPIARLTGRSARAIEIG